MTIGVSEATPIKQRDITQISDTIFKIISNIIKKKKNYNDDRIWVFDLNAGEGDDGNGTPGSAIIFAEKLYSLYKKHKVCSELILIEKNIEHYRKLCNNIKQLSERINPLKESGVRIRFGCGDNNDVIELFFIEEKIKLRYGLCYHDPNGTPDIKLLSKIFDQKCFSKIDLILNFSNMAIARTAGYYNSPKRPSGFVRKCEYRPLEECLKDINKKYWFKRCREIGKHKWTLVIGTNWDNFPEFKKIEFERFKV